MMFNQTEDVMQILIPDAAVPVYGIDGGMSPMVQIHYLYMDKTKWRELCMGLLLGKHSCSPDYPHASILIGIDKIHEISDHKEPKLPTKFYVDLTDSLAYQGHGTILSSEIQGALLIPTTRAEIAARPKPEPKPAREISHRELLSSAHISAVVKILARHSIHETGMYKEGYCAAISRLCKGLGVPVPISLPFQNIAPLPEEEILDAYFANQ
jgi:hypothetical protein